MVEPVEPGGKEGPLLHRLGWFFGIALASLLVVASAAYLMRALLFMG